MTVGMSCRSLEIQTLENRWFSYLVEAFLQVIFFFVLTKGMSIVGPRPALPSEVENYSDYQLQRLLVKPGDLDL